MRRVLTIKGILFGLLTVFVSTSVFAQIPKQTDPVVFVRVYSNKTGLNTMTGSGLLLNRHGFILTAKHVVQNIEDGTIFIHLKSRNNAPIPAQLVDCATGLSDICLLKIQEADVSAQNINAFYQLSCRQIQEGETIYAAGYPFGEYNPILRTQGKTAGSLAHDVTYPSDITLVPGMSGGPIFDTEGRVVALTFGGAKNAPTLTFLSPLFSAKALIERGLENCASDPIATNQSPAVLSKVFRVDETKDDHPNVNPHSRPYKVEYEAEPGYAIEKCEWIEESAASASDKHCNVGPGGRYATFHFRLTSGPFFDRWRGWVHGYIKVTQTKLVSPR
ncbi:MAG: trypsin-like peptidase domain-containing protein [Xanthobacteraceae bacterium]|nr:trypsin-like peptidase domain-containing protein [Xanthobacteraceae bacterium]